MSKLLDPKDHGVSQLISSKNEWAKELWAKGAANHWMPQQIGMQEDIKQWKDPKFFSVDERLLVKRSLGLFAAGESLVSNSIETGEWPFITDAACRQYMIRKNWDESVHNWTVKICCESFNLSIEEVAEAYKNIPTIKAKERFLMESLSNFKDKDFDISTITGKQKFLKNMAVFYLVCEGTWFFSNFAILMSMGRQNKLPGLMDQISYSIRDEVLHIEFGTKVLSQTQEEYPEVWTQEFKKEVADTIKRGAEIEFEYARDVLPNGILGVTQEMLTEYIKFLANSRISNIGLPRIFEESKNPFPWLGEAQDSSKMSAFFERHEKSYQNAGALKDDF
jgi:ribonucleoside-diphosphate reductase beta chain